MNQSVSLAGPSDRNLLDGGTVQGRITEIDLPAAEKTFPGISAMYEQLQEKPKTFLQLVWLYEDLMTELAREDTPSPDRWTTAN